MSDEEFEQRGPARKAFDSFSAGRTKPAGLLYVLNHIHDNGTMEECMEALESIRWARDNLKPPVVSDELQNQMNDLRMKFEVKIAKQYTNDFYLRERERKEETEKNSKEVIWKFTCSQCGAPLEIYPIESQVSCKFCGSSYSLGKTL